MGRQHGDLLRAAGGGDDILDHYPDMPERLILDGSPASALMRPIVGGVKEVLLRVLEHHRPAEYRARSRAALTALGRASDFGRYLGVMDLFQNVIGTAGRLAVGPFARAAKLAALHAAQPACSTVMAWGGSSQGGVMRHARNFDFPGIGVWDSSPSLVFCSPTQGQRYAFLTARGADAAVVTVFNEAGLVITSHTRFHRDVSFRGMAIVDLVHDLVRRAETIRDALAIARERRAASTWGLAVSSWRERTAGSLEVHAGRVELVTPPAGADALVVCNRYRHPAMQAGEIIGSEAWRLQSDQRERRLRALVDAARARGGADMAELAAMLADRHLPDDAPDAPARHAGGTLAQACTVHSVVVEPEAQTLALGIGAAPACEGPWLRLRWSWDGAVGSWELGARGAVPGIATEELATTIERSPAATAAAEALRIAQSTHDDAAISAALARAAAAAPDDPSLQLALLWMSMRAGDLGGAVEHAAAGLVGERTPYPRAQLLLWGARAAAAAGDVVQAEDWRRELEALTGESVDELQAEGRADARRPPRLWKRRRPEVNLFMMDAM